MAHRSFEHLKVGDVAALARSFGASTIEVEVTRVGRTLLDVAETRAAKSARPYTVNRADGRSKDGTCRLVDLVEHRERQHQSDVRKTLLSAGLSYSHNPNQSPPFALLEALAAVVRRYQVETDRTATRISKNP